MTPRISGGTGSHPVRAVHASMSAVNALPRKRTERLQAIDAARGLAMVLVCISHVRVHFRPESPELYFLLTSITRIATPTFLLLSGFVAGYVLANGGRNVRLTLIDRGLFVVLIGHFLLNLEDLRTQTLQHWIFGRVTVTDAIGVCLICAPLLARLPAIRLGGLGAALALLSWPVAMTQAFEQPLARHLGAALFNLRSETGALVDAAIVPYLGIFALGMAFSKASAADLKRANLNAVARRMCRAGIASIALVITALGSWFALKRFGLAFEEPFWAELARMTLDPRSKLPPSPAYLLFYGGLGLLLTAWCLIAKPQRAMRPLIKWSATIGRASLMCFIAQDWMLRLLPALLEFEDSTSMLFWAAYGCLAITILHWFARHWDGARANRFLTLGVRRLRAPPIR
jgi:uncharacterized membrane protein YcfT